MSARRHASKCSALSGSSTATSAASANRSAPNQAPLHREEREEGEEWRGAGANSGRTSLNLLSSLVFISIHCQDLAALERETRALKAEVDAFRADAAARRAGVEALVLREVRAAAGAVASASEAAEEAVAVAEEAVEEAGKAAAAGVDALAATRALEALEREVAKRGGGGEGGGGGT